MKLAILSDTNKALYTLEDFDKFDLYNPVSVALILDFLRESMADLEDPLG